MPSVSGWGLRHWSTRDATMPPPVSMPSVSGWGLRLYMDACSVLKTVSMPSVSGWGLRPPAGAAHIVHGACLYALGVGLGFATFEITGHDGADAVSMPSVSGWGL